MVPKDVQERDSNAIMGSSNRLLLGRNASHTWVMSTASVTGVVIVDSAQTRYARGRSVVFSVEAEAGRIAVGRPHRPPNESPIGA
jgi:hypothetical protein